MCAQLYLTLATPRTVACQAPLSVGFSRQEYWSGLPFPSPGERLPVPVFWPGEFHGLYSPWGGKESACQCRTHRFNPWVGKIPWRRKWQPTPIFLSEKSYGQRSLAGYSPWGCKSQIQLGTHSRLRNIHFHQQIAKGRLQGSLTLGEEAYLAED